MKNWNVTGGLKSSCATRLTSVQVSLQAERDPFSNKMHSIKDGDIERPPWMQECIASVLRNRRPMEWVAEQEGSPIQSSTVVAIIQDSTFWQDLGLLCKVVDPFRVITG
jgi:hypothetical protein